MIGNLQFIQRHYSVDPRHRYCSNSFRIVNSKQHHMTYFDIFRFCFWKTCIFSPATRIFRVVERTSCRTRIDLFLNPNLSSKMRVSFYQWNAHFRRRRGWKKEKHGKRRQIFWPNIDFDPCEKVGTSPFKRGPVLVQPGSLCLFRMSQSNGRCRGRHQRTCTRRRRPQPFSPDLIIEDLDTLLWWDLFEVRLGLNRRQFCR